MKTPSSAFSLVELSIVLVILGLLVGGVLAGKSLIRASEIRAVGREAEQYITAVRTFRDKYQALPGDMSNATKFWGIAGGTTGNDWTCGQVASTGPATCNGDGNGYLNYTPSPVVYEDLRSWQHMANAGIISGTYSGTYIPPLYGAIPGTDRPKSKMPNAMWSFQSTSAAVLNYFELASYSWGSDILAPEDAWNIDTKIDDGMPLTGKMVAWENTVDTCTDAVTSQYKLTNSARSCAFQIFPFDR